MTGERVASVDAVGSFFGAAITERHGLDTTTEDGSLSQTNSSLQMRTDELKAN